MANLLDIRRRIRSVRNTQQITKAMKTVAAARLRRAEERIVNARPYADQLRILLGNLAGRSENVRHPLLELRPEDRVLILVVTADKGLCGGFNANILRGAQSLLAANREKGVSLFVAGRKGREFFKRRGVAIAGELTNFFTSLNYEHAKRISTDIIALYSGAEIDAVYLVYNEFKSVLRQTVATERLLPLNQTDFASGANRIDYIYEQSPQEIFDHLLPRYVEVQVFRALLESAAAEHAARMTAMDTATNNAADMIDALTLNMNRVRQASITREIIEVVSGSGALNG